MSTTLPFLNIPWAIANKQVLIQENRLSPFCVSRSRRFRNDLRTFKRVDERTFSDVRLTNQSDGYVFPTKINLGLSSYVLDFFFARLLLRIS